MERYITRTLSVLKAVPERSNVHFFLPYSERKLHEVHYANVSHDILREMIS